MLIQKLQDFIVNQIIHLKFMDGYRTAFGGAFFILTGVGLYANMFASGVYDHDTAMKADGMIGAGLVIVGGAGKIDKLIESNKGK